MRKSLFSLLFVALCTIGLFSCRSNREKAKHTAIEHLKMSVDNGNALRIDSVSKPDSAFGLHYFSSEDKSIIMNVMRRVSDTIMKRTYNMERFDPRDNYVMTLIDRQMRVGNELRSALYTKMPQEAYSGWKVRIAYRGVSHQSQEYHALRWYFIDNDGETIIKTMEIPMP